MPDRLVFAGVGDESPMAMRQAGAALARAASKQTHLVVDLNGLDRATEAAVGAFIEGLLLGSYRHPFTGTGSGPDDPCPQITLVGGVGEDVLARAEIGARDRKSTRLNSSHVAISYAVFCLKKKNEYITP